jgi:serine/threonine-protein kinase
LRTASSKVNRLTKEGSTVGTAGYMSPEQVLGQEADHRSDIFSLGVVLYEMISGQLPFRGVHETALAYEIVNVDPQPMSTVKPGIDPELDRIVLECLQKEPSERFQSVAEISKDLKRYKRESGRQAVSRISTSTRAYSPGVPVQASTPVSAAPPARRPLLWPLLSALLAACLVGAGWMLWKRADSGIPTLRLSIALPKDQPIETEASLAVAISSDGSRVVYRAGGKLYQRRLDSFDPQPIEGTEGGTNPFFSPDGRWIGFFGGGGLKKVSPGGGTPVALIDEITDNRGAAWSVNDMIAYAPRGNTGLYLMRADGSGNRPLTFLDSTRSERTHRWPQFLPDGKTLMFTVGTMGSPDYYEDAEIDAVNVETGVRTNVMTGASSAACGPAGYLIYSHTGDLFAAPFELSGPRIMGPGVPVLTKVAGDQTTGAVNYAISANGFLAFVSGRMGGSENRELVMADMNGVTTPLPFPPQDYMEPRISPDGKKLAVVVGSVKDLDIWICDLQLGTMNRFTFGGQNRSPVWSPDGQRIAFADDSPAKPGVVIRRADGTGPTEAIGIGHRCYVNDWSPDGKTLIVSIPFTSTGWDLYVIDLAGDRKAQAWLQTEVDEFSGSLSPDGRWISFNNRERGALGKIVVRPFPRGEARWQVSPGLAYESHWSRDGKSLYYTSPQGLFAVPVGGTQSFSVGQPKIIIKDFRRIAVESAMTFDPTPDRRHILFARTSESTASVSDLNVITNWFEEIRKSVNSQK